MFFHWGYVFLSSHFGCFFVFSALVVNLISDIDLSYNQQPSFSITGCSRAILVGRLIASTQADTLWRRVLCLVKMAPAVWGMTQHRDPGGISFSSLPRDTDTRFPSSISSPHCLPSARDQDEWLQMKFYAFAL